ncbi:hypothetical protein J6590_000957 [Homalodisca vitripennis]|nr:hypothetical protein J6590_000957 [Homalodisca vitripennis]
MGDKVDSFPQKFPFPSTLSTTLWEKTSGFISVDLDSDSECVVKDHVTAGVNVPYRCTGLVYSRYNYHRQRQSAANPRHGSRKTSVYDRKPPCVMRRGRPVRLITPYTDPVMTPQRLTGAATAAHITDKCKVDARLLLSSKKWLLENSE